MGKVDLATFNNSDFHPGGKLKMLLWYFVNVLCFQNPLNPLSGLKIHLLRLFGAKIGAGVIIKPSVNIKYPWKLEIGNHTWIGENVWIDNLDMVSIGNHCCVSQGALLLCGNHNYKKTSFDLITGTITLEDGSWVGAKTVVCPGVTCKSHSILTVGSVATTDLESYGIYRGNPATQLRKRTING